MENGAVECGLHNTEEIKFDNRGEREKEFARTDVEGDTWTNALEILMDRSVGDDVPWEWNISSLFIYDQQDSSD